MNDLQRLQIKQLRAAGLGYKEIGKRLKDNTDYEEEMESFYKNVREKRPAEYS